jgi:hypothetical protein
MKCMTQLPTPLTLELNDAGETMLRHDGRDVTTVSCRIP